MAKGSVSAVWWITLVMKLLMVLLEVLSTDEPKSKAVVLKGLKDLRTE